MGEDMPRIAGTLSIRPMEPGDREAVAALLLDLNRVENAFTGDRHVEVGAGHDCLAENERYIAEQGGAILVAAAGSEVVGTLLLAFETAAAYVRPDLRACARVLDLVVATHARGTGIGSMLLMEAETFAREAGLSALLIGAVSDNAGAIALYERTGFRRQAIELLKPLRPS